MSHMINADKHQCFYQEIAHRLHANKVDGTGHTLSLPAKQDKARCLESIHKFIVDHKTDIPRLYRYSPVDTYNVVPLLLNSIGLVTADHMKDKLEGIVYDRTDPTRDCISKIQEFQEKTYIKSFCTKSDDKEQWEKYGDAHRGICITYDFSCAKESLLKHLYPVFYFDGHFSCEHFDALKFSPYFFLLKSDRYSPESEWRLIYQERETKNPLLNVSPCIAEIELGAYMDSGVRKFMIDAINIVKKRKNHFNPTLYDEVVDLTITRKGIS